MSCPAVVSINIDRFADSHRALTHALDIRNAGDLAALERFCEAALQRFTHDIELSWQLSYCYWQRHDSVRAEAVMREAVLRHPGDARLTGAVAMYVNEQARYDDAETLYRKAIAQSPDDVELAIDLADLELRRGAWREGWTRFERRLDNPRHGENSVVTRMERAAPRWRGQALAGKRVVVYSEIGHGDDLQFVRLYPRFAERVRAHGGEPVLAARGVLHPLIERSIPGCVLLEASTFDDCDYSVAMMSMPFLLGTLPADIDGRPYLHANPARVATWRRLLEADGTNDLRVGIVWAGSPTHRRDAMRSIPVDALAPLWSLPKVKFYPLAPGRDADVARMRAAGAPMVEVAQRYRDHFHDSAALLSALDVLVSIDSSPLHLGGALGRPVLAMIDFASHWCWGCGETQPWYESVRLLRQEKAGDWRPVVTRVAKLLRAQHARTSSQR